MEEKIDVFVTKGQLLGIASLAFVAVVIGRIEEMKLAKLMHTLRHFPKTNDIRQV